MRSTEVAVRQVIDTGLASGQVTQFIEDAALWVDEELGASGLSDGRLELIERYLACTLIRLRDLGLSSSTLGDVSDSYQVDPQITDYLHRAAGFDSTGKVRAAFLPAAAAAGPTGFKFRVGAGFTGERSRGA